MTRLPEGTAMVLWVPEKPAAFHREVSEALLQVSGEAQR